MSGIFESICCSLFVHLLHNTLYECAIIYPVINGHLVCLQFLTIAIAVKIFCVFGEHLYISVGKI